MVNTITTTVILLTIIASANIVTVDIIKPAASVDRVDLVAAKVVPCIIIMVICVVIIPNVHHQA